MNPFQVKNLLQRGKVGIKVNSIIGNPLYFPDDQSGKEELMFQNASAGLWNVYDFTTPRRFVVNKLIEQNFMHDMSLMFFPIEDELVNSESDIEEETIDGYFEFFHFDHLIHFTTFSVKEALEYGAIRETTYAEAYERVGNDNYISDVKELGITDKTVYQVTPKGNTLIFPGKKSGDKTPPKTHGSPEGNKGLITA